MLHALAAALLLSAAARPAPNDGRWPEERAIIGDEDDEPPEPPVEAPPPAPPKPTARELELPARPAPPEGKPLNPWQTERVKTGVTLIAFGAPLTISGAVGATVGVIGGIVAVATSAGGSYVVGGQRLDPALPLLIGLIPSAAFIATGVPLILSGQHALEEGLSATEAPPPPKKKPAVDVVPPRFETR
jgi:hypothetical protein